MLVEAELLKQHAHIQDVSTEVGALARVARRGEPSRRGCGVERADLLSLVFYLVRAQIQRAKLRRRRVEQSDGARAVVHVREAIEGRWHRRAVLSRERAMMLPVLLLACLLLLVVAEEILDELLAPLVLARALELLPLVIHARALGYTRVDTRAPHLQRLIRHRRPGSIETEPEV